jgi:hypothetical protein
MKVTIALILLWGLVVSPCAHADTTKLTRPRWAIVMTVTDRTSGELLEQRELDTELEFDDVAQCESIVARVGPIADDHSLAIVLTCREVTRI